MKRTIITIDEAACTGCGLCAEACHEGAIAIVDGKAKLIRDDYCDGLGNCLPVCPVDAIHVIEREAAAYDEAAVKRAKLEKLTAEAVKTCRRPKKPDVPAPDKLACGCPGTQVRAMHHPAAAAQPAPGQLQNWPVQLRLVPVRAPYFDGCDLLIAADCTGLCLWKFSRGLHPRPRDAHRLPEAGHRGLRGEADRDPHGERRAQRDAPTRMEVPCCGGLEYAARQAIAHSGRALPARRDDQRGRPDPAGADNISAVRQTTRPGPRRGQHRPSRGLFISKWILIIYFIFIKSDLTFR